MAASLRTNAVIVTRIHCISYKIAFVSTEYSDQSSLPQSLIRNFAGHSVGSQGSKTFSGGQQRLIKLHVCTGWSESSLAAHKLLQEMLCLGWFDFSCYVYQSQYIASSFFILTKLRFPEFLNQSVGNIVPSLGEINTNNSYNSVNRALIQPNWYTVNSRYLDPAYLE